MVNINSRYLGNQSVTAGKIIKATVAQALQPAIYLALLKAGRDAGLHFWSVAAGLRAHQSHLLESELL